MYRKNPGWVALARRKGGSIPRFPDEPGGKDDVEDHSEGTNEHLMAKSSVLSPQPTLSSDPTALNMSRICQEHSGMAPSPVPLPGGLVSGDNEDDERYLSDMRSRFGTVSFSLKVPLGCRVCAPLSLPMPLKHEPHTGDFCEFLRPGACAHVTMSLHACS